MKLFASSTLLLCLLLFTQTIIAQTKQQVKAEKDLVQYLNNICKTHTENEMPIDMGTIVQPYSIKNGTLTVMRKYKSGNDSSVFYVRTSVIISSIHDVFYDYYVGFVGSTETSVTDELLTNPNSTGTTSTKHLMHITPVSNNDQGPLVQEKLIQLVNNLHTAYNKSR
jgi:hypothetical protein